MMALSTVLFPAVTGLGDTVSAAVLVALVGVGDGEADAEPEPAPVQPDIRPKTGKNKRQAKAIGREVMGPTELYLFCADKYMTRSKLSSIKECKILFLFFLPPFLAMDALA
jgi:hypothetical protein